MESRGEKEGIETGCYTPRRPDTTPVRTELPDVEDNLEDVIEAGREDGYLIVREGDKRGRWARARRVIMGMGHV